MKEKGRWNMALYSVRKYKFMNGQIVKNYGVSSEKISSNYAFWKRTIDNENLYNCEHTKLTVSEINGKKIVTSAITVFPDGYIVDRVLLLDSFKDKK